VTIAADGAYNDRESVTVDPTRPGHAYFVWVKRYGTFGESLLANLTPFLPAGSPIVPWQVMAARSRDAGSHWSAPIGIGSIGHPFAPEDPTTGTQVRAYPVISAAVAPSGEAYVVWNEIKSKRSSRIFLSRSGDGGIDWSPPKPIATFSTQAFLPSIAVARTGRSASPGTPSRAIGAAITS
jgi:hypothetical protein